MGKFKEKLGGKRPPKGEPARPAGEGTARVHALRRVDPHGHGADESLAWYAIELTVMASAPKRTAYDLTLVGATALDAAAEAAVVDARVWDEERWLPVEAQTIWGEQRLRLRVGLPPDAVGTWQVCLDGGVLGTCNLERAGLYGHGGEDETRFDITGECGQCGNYEMISDEGFCRNCTGQPACVNHADAISAGRCLGCREPHCRACLKNGFCDPCREHAGRRPSRSGRGAGGAGKGAQVLRQAVDAVKARRRTLIGIVAAAVLLKVGHLGYEVYTAPVEKFSAEQLARRDMETVVGAVVTLKQQGGLPANAAAISAFLKEAAIVDAPAVIDAGQALTPGAVIYTKKDKTFELTQVDAGGKLVEWEGKPLVVTRGDE